MILMDPPLICERGEVARPLRRLVAAEVIRWPDAEKVIERMPEQAHHVEKYAFEAMDIGSLIVERMKLMSSEQYEELLRPAFRDDEKTVVAVGAILGFIVGELQAQLLL